MAITTNQSTVVLLGALLSTSVFFTTSASAAANVATSDRLSEPPVATIRLPDEAELKSMLAHLDGFMIQMNRYISDVYRLTEDYKQYVQRVKQMLATCELNEDISTFEAEGFSGLASAEEEQCTGWVENFDDVAWQHANALTTAQEYQQLIEKLGENVSRQQDRILIAMHARRLNGIIEKGFRTVKSSREGFAPWMDK